MEDLRKHLNRGMDWLSDTLNNSVTLQNTDAASATKEANSLLKAGVEAQKQKNYALANELFQDALTLSNKWALTVQRVNSHHNLGMIAAFQYDCARARHHLEQSLAASEKIFDPNVRFITLKWLGEITHGQGDIEASLAYRDAFLLFAEYMRDEMWIASAKNHLGLVSVDYGDLISAGIFFEDSLALFRKLSNLRGVAYALTNQGGLAARQGDYSGARSLMAESLRYFRELEDKRGTSYAVTHLASLARKEKDYEEALSLYRLSLSLWLQSDSRWLLAPCLEGSAAVAVALGQYARAARLYGAAYAIRKRQGTALVAHRKEDWEQNLLAARSRLTKDEFETLWAEGRALSLEQSVAYAQQDET